MLKNLTNNFNILTRFGSATKERLQTFCAENFCMWEFQENFLSVLSLQFVNKILIKLKISMGFPHTAVLKLNKKIDSVKKMLISICFCKIKSEQLQRTATKIPWKNHKPFENFF